MYIYSKMKLNKKGDFELDQLGKLIIAAIVLILLIVIITVYIGGELGNQEDRITSIFNLF